MDEDDGFAAVEEVPDGCQGWVAEVIVAVSVAGEKDDSVGLEGVEGVSHLLQCCLRVQQVWDGREEAVVLRVSCSDFGVEFVARACELLRFLGLFLDVGAWCSYRKDGGGYADLVA